MHICKYAQAACFPISDRILIVEYVCKWFCVFVNLQHYFVLSLLSQQLLREMQQMASRPFATINVALETDEEPPDLIGGNVKVSVTF